MGIINPILNIIDKVTNRFNWDRKSIRRNKIAKLKKKELELMSKEWTVSLGSELASVRMQIARLEQEAIND